MKNLSLIIPFHNEERTLGELIRQIHELPRGVVSDVIFVNDGSDDHSLEVLQDSLAKYPFPAKTITKKNGGKSSAVFEGTKHLETSHVLILDADLELNTLDVVRLWEIVISGKSEIVFGYRQFLSQSSFTYRYARGNVFLSQAYGILYNEVITDIMCGLKLLPSSLLQNCPFKYSKFAIEIEIPLYLWLQRLRPFEIQVDYTPRSQKDGKVIGIKDAIQIIFDLLYFRIFASKKRIK
jgi:glycosyltransferase involved in cell wall biosynthesis